MSAQSAHDTFRQIAPETLTAADLQVWADACEEIGLTSLAECKRHCAAAGETLSIVLHVEKVTAANAKRKVTVAARQNAVAMAIAESYHAHVADLYQSKRADVVVGRGGQEDLDWDAYGKSGKNYAPNGRGIPAKWKNAGVRIVDSRIVIETARGTEVARLPMPPKGADCTSNALVSGDLYAAIRQIGQAKVATRYGPTFAKKIATGYRVTGIAVRFPVTAELREFKSWSGTTEWYWEHGTTVAQCREEYARKLTLAQADHEQRTAVKLADDTAKAAARKLDRFTRLVCRLCGKLIVTDADRRACGYCDAGTTGWIARYPQFAGRTELTATELRNTNDAQVERPIRAAAERIAREKLAA